MSEFAAERTWKNWAKALWSLLRRRPTAWAIEVGSNIQPGHTVRFSRGWYYDCMFWGEATRDE